MSNKEYGYVYILIRSTSGRLHWNCTEVLEVHEALQKANESINKLGLVPVSL